VNTKNHEVLHQSTRKTLFPSSRTARIAAVGKLPLETGKAESHENVQTRAQAIKNPFIRDYKNALGTSKSLRLSYLK